MTQNVTTNRNCRRCVTVQKILPVAAADIFDFLAQPANHRRLDGSDTLQGTLEAPDRLSLGATFTMHMQQSRFRYASHNRVVEWERDAILTWETTGRWRGHRTLGGQWWRWQMLPTPDSTDGLASPERKNHGGQSTIVRHSYIWGNARLPLLTIALLGYPARMRSAMTQSLERLQLLLNP